MKCIVKGGKKTKNKNKKKFFYKKKPWKNKSLGTQKTNNKNWLCNDDEERKKTKRKQNITN